MVKKSRILKRPESKPMLIGTSIAALLESMGGRRERCLLPELWKNWQKVVGDDFASQVEIKGHKGTTLFLSVEDSLSIQELSYQSEEILEKINSFLKMEYFTRIRFNVKGLT